ncbi:MAG TPA: hypothetical protein VMB22_05015 [Verrucomicrobiae bacterium]|nr:hypothetical protein [Verrucomicrobiae bacterium]
MSNLTIGVLGALLATNQPQAVSNLVQQDTGVSVSIPNPDDPEQMALQKVMADDDAALAEVDSWIRENDAFAAQGGGEPREELNQRIKTQLDSIRKEYEDFLQRYPNDARGHLAYGSFLNEIGDEDTAAAQIEIAARLDPKNPAAWNNLANYYGEHGPLTNAFADYAKAIDLNPDEPVYYQNLATMVYLYRKDAEKYYGLSEQQIFDKALALYQKAVRLDPDNFPLATDYAETYYGIRPLRTNDALVAWTNALKIARNDVEREGVYIHLARIKTLAGLYNEARAQLDAVTNSNYADLKKLLERNIAEREEVPTNSAAATTNGASVSIPVQATETNAMLTVTNDIRVLTNIPPLSSGSKLP